MFRRAYYAWDFQARTLAVAAIGLAIMLTSAGYFVGMWVALNITGHGLLGSQSMFIPCVVVSIGGFRFWFALRNEIRDLAIEPETDQEDQP